MHLPHIMGHYNVDRLVVYDWLYMGQVHGVIVAHIWVHIHSVSHTSKCLA